MEKQNTRQLPNDTAMAWYMVDRYSTVEKKKKFGETRYCEILLNFVPRNFVEISLKCTCKVTSNVGRNFIEISRKQCTKFSKIRLHYFCNVFRKQGTANNAMDFFVTTLNPVGILLTAFQSYVLHNPTSAFISTPNASTSLANA